MEDPLKMTDIRSFAMALNISWIKKVCHVNYQADWKRLFVWLLNKKSLSFLASSFVEILTRGMWLNHGQSIFVNLQQLKRSSVTATME